MKWASAISHRTAFKEAVRECVEGVRSGLGGERPSVLFAFATPHFAASFGGLYDDLSDAFDPECFIGCSGGGVLGAGREIEGSPALSLVGAYLPDVELTPFRIEDGEMLPDLDGPPDAWERLLGVDASRSPSIVLLADPFSSRTEALISGLDYAYPDAPKVGGLVSGGPSPGTNSLFLNGDVFSGGSVGLTLTGDVRVDTVVAQGCRPVGDLMTVTACEGNYLYGLDDAPALEAVRGMFAGLEPDDLELARGALFIGVLMDEFTEKPGPGDFLIRNVLGFDPGRGTLAVGEQLQNGMRLQFHVRDARTSAEDLRILLDAYSEVSGDTPPDGALLFSCLGRGRNLYGEPDFDSSLLAERFGSVPVGGFFCNGEIGPVGGSTFLHGYTSSFAFFRPDSTPTAEN
ncbi:FIST signal transduction protein [Rubrobacter indicoceani]|uniref:FIST signal transduction protein n=1 Tax=Rubrobacter indicoceani TaxID=2051957 RepID=UPI000E5B4699|nr:FIST N-terminal domain-containing protein [Rubrobacter indicoceani]